MAPRYPREIPVWWNLKKAFEEFTSQRGREGIYNCNVHFLAKCSKKIAVRVVQTGRTLQLSQAEWNLQATLITVVPKREKKLCFWLTCPCCVLNLPSDQVIKQMLWVCKITEAASKYLSVIKFKRCTPKILNQIKYIKHIPLLIYWPIMNGVGSLIFVCRI